MSAKLEIPTRFTRLIVRAAHIFFYSDLHCVRFLLAFSELVWAATLMFWDGVFARPTYGQMGKVMSEKGWALVFLLSGITQLIVLLSGKYHDRLAVVFAGWNSTLWWYVVLSMYMPVYPPAPGISGELGMAMGAAWVFMRSGVGPAGRRAADAKDA